MDIIQKEINIQQGLKLKNEEELNYLLKIIDELLVGILMIDLNSTVIYVNKKYSEITGVAYENIVNRHINDVRPKAILGKVMKAGKPESNVFRQEGDVKYFVDVAPIVINDRIIGGITVMKDFEDAQIITDRLKQAEDRVRNIEKLLSNKFTASYSFEDIIGDSSALKQTVILAKKISNSEASVLITGKTGTGKELFAQSIHNHSKRRNKTFMPINCASIPKDLIESELFGYAQGSFTGADKNGKLGLFELANEGTVFLDEIENMSLDLQKKLLRVLQERKVKRLGGNQYIDLNVRIIAATNVNMEELINNGIFREDLYYRLCVFPIHIPALIDRREDIRVLVDYFLKKFNSIYNAKTSISGNAMKKLENYNWPGNIRELSNTIEFLISIDEAGITYVDDLPNRIKYYKTDGGRKNTKETKLKDQIKIYEKQIISDYIDRYGNKVDDKIKIADFLGISISTLYNKLKEFELI